MWHSFVFFFAFHLPFQTSCCEINWLLIETTYLGRVFKRGFWWLIFMLEECMRWITCRTIEFWSNYKKGDFENIPFRARVHLGNGSRSLSIKIRLYIKFITWNSKNKSWPKNIIFYCLITSVTCINWEYLASRISYPIHEFIHMVKFVVLNLASVSELYWMNSP